MVQSPYEPLAIILAGLAWLVLLALAAAGRGRGPRERDALHRAAGKRGEDLVTRTLQRVLGPDHTLVTDARTHSPGHTAQLDHLVLGPQGVILLEVKFWRGAMTRGGGGGAGTWELKSLSRGRARYSSPETQALQHMDVVRQVLRHAGLGRLPVWTAVVLAHPRSRFSEATGLVPVLRTSELAAWITGLPTLPSPPDEGLRRRIVAAVDQGYGTAQRLVPWE